MSPLMTSRSTRLSCCAFLLTLTAIACTKTPQQAIESSTASVTDGFRSRGGVALSDQHVVADLELIETSESTSVRVGLEPPKDGRIITREAGLGLAVIYVDSGVDGSALGDSGALEIGATIHAGVFGAAGISMKSGQISGVRFHKKRWYFETDLALPEAGRGAGVFSDSGELIGVYAFQLAPGLNYILPVEYVVSTADGPAASALEHEASASFTARAKEASESDIVLEPPPRFESLTTRHNYAHRDLVGVVTHQRNDAPQFETIAWTLAAVNDKTTRTPIANGTLGDSTAEWSMDEEELKSQREALVTRFGEELATERFDPYQLGELRFRIPGAAYCKAVEPGVAYALTVQVDPERKTEEMTYGDLANVCADLEAGDGATWLESWGIAAKTAVETAPRGKKKRKGKKKRRRRGRR